MMSIEVGKGNKQAGQTLFSQSMLLTAILTTVAVTLALFWLDEIIGLVGASGNIAMLANEYLSVLLKMFVLYSLAWVLSCFVRNDTNPRLATIAMSVGAISNLVMDYFFVLKFGWGMKGAAYATAISQVIIAVILLSHFVKKKGNLELSFKGIGLGRSRDILKIGTPIFFIEITSAMTIFMFNYVLLHHYGESHIIAYGLTSNIGVFALFVMVGIAQACQPIVSFNHGAGRPQRIQSILTLGLKAATGSGFVFMIVVWLFAPQIASIYLGNSAELTGLAATALTFYFFGVPLMGLNMVIANLFQAVASPKNATIISLCRGFILVAVGMVLLPQFFPEKGIWGSILFAEAGTAVISLVMLRGYKSRELDKPLNSVQAS